MKQSTPLGLTSSSYDTTEKIDGSSWMNAYYGIFEDTKQSQTQMKEQENENTKQGRETYEEQLLRYQLGLQPNNKENKIEIDRRKLKIGLILSEPYVMIDKPEIESKVEDKQQKQTYKGLVYDIWEKIKDNLVGYEYEEIPLEEKSFNDHLKDLEKGKYDLLVGNIWNIKERTNMVSFSRPLFLSKIVIAFKPNKTKAQIYLEMIQKSYVLPLTILVLFSLLFGYILFRVEKFRGLRRAIWTTVGTFLGESGWLFEQSRLHYTAMSIIILIMVIAYYYTVFLQASATSDILTREKQDITASNLQYKFFVLSKEFNIGDLLKKYKLRYELVDIPKHELAEYYLNNTQKYNGYIVDYEQIKRDMKKFPELDITSDNFGHQENALAMKIGDTKLAEDINIAIAKLQSFETIKNICTLYIGKEDARLCIL